MSVGGLIKDTAMTWLGTPYSNNAMAKGYGVDCAHFLLGTLIDAKLLDSADMTIEYYSNEWHLHRSEEKFLKYIRKVAYEVETLEVGDFLLYQYGRCISHGGVYVGDNMVIHSYIDQGVILSKLDDVIFYDNVGKSRLRCIYRFNERG